MREKCSYFPMNYCSRIWKDEQVSYYQMRNFFHNVELTCLKCAVRLDKKWFD